MYYLAKTKDEINWLIKPEWWFSRLSVKRLYNNPTKDKSIYLTFDDGPNPNTTPIILELLKSYKAKATFFLIGDNAKRYPDIVEAIKSHGHDIGYHTMHHGVVLLWARPHLERDFQEFSDVIGSVPSFARPPFAIANPYWYSLFRDLGIQTVFTDAYPRDKTIKSEARLFNRLKTVSRNNSTVLLHDGDKTDPTKKMPTLLKVLPRFLEYLKQTEFAIRLMNSK